MPPANAYHGGDPDIIVLVLIVIEYLHPYKYFFRYTPLTVLYMHVCYIYTTFPGDARALVADKIQHNGHM
jgi:hypothetical protein